VERKMTSGLRKPDTCTGCPFYRSPMVPAVGNLDARVLIVGESPGKQEMVEHTPFVGQSGRILRHAFPGFELEKHTRIVNTVCCYLGVANEKNDDALEQVATHCVQNVFNEIRTMPNLELILCVGGVATRALTGKSSTDLHSIEDFSVQERHFKLVPCSHPAQLLRSPESWLLFRMRTALVRRFLQREPIEQLFTDVEAYATTDVRVISNSKAVRLALKALQTSELLAADIETSGFSSETDRILCLGIYSLDVPFPPIVFPEELVYDKTVNKLLKRFFTAKQRQWIWHNGQFDIRFLGAAGIPARVDQDTMLLHYAFWEHPPHDLKSLGATFLGMRNYEKDIHATLKHPKSDSYSLVPRELLQKYLACDVVTTGNLFRVLLPLAKASRGQWSAYNEILLPASKFLTDVGRRGIYIDTAHLDNLEATIGVREKELTREMQKAFSLETFNPNSPAQVAHILYDILHLPQLTRKRETGEEVLKDLQERAIGERSQTFLGMLLEQRKAKKIMSSYVTKMRTLLDPETHRVYPQFLLHRTVTGRLVAVDPPVQTVPREKVVKDIFSSPPGRLLLEMDYSQTELRVLALLSRDKNLTQLFVHGEDLHDKVSRQIFGNHYTKEQREITKTVTFGILYNRQAPSIASQLTRELKKPVSIQFSQRLIEDWGKLFPQAWKYLKEQPILASTQGWLETPFGRRRHFPVVSNFTLSSLGGEARNFAIQSTASDLTLLSGIHLTKQLLSKMSGNLGVVNLVHDSLLLEVPDGITKKEVQKIATCIQTFVKRRSESPFSWKVSAEVGKSWGSLDAFIEE